MIPSHSLRRENYETNRLLLTITIYKLICHNGNSSSIRVQTIYLVGKARSRSKILQIAVYNIRKIDVLVSEVNRDIIEGVELATEVIIGEN